VLPGTDFFLWLSYTQGIQVYSYTFENLELRQTLGKFYGGVEGEKIVDGVVNGTRLFVLGLQTYTYIYERDGNGNFKSKLNVSMENICVNCMHRQIMVHKNNIYIYSIESGEEFVSELQYDAQLAKVSLIRYFKGNRNLVLMTVLDGKLMLSYNHIVNLYETNKDPRTITKLLNGISNVHVDEIAKL
jgi:hypothetical protein